MGFDVEKLDSIVDTNVESCVICVSAYIGNPCSGLLCSVLLVFTVGVKRHWMYVLDIEQFDQVPTCSQ